MKKRDLRIDFLKGIAILGVVVFHFSSDYLPYGYLGVDIFLVIIGYLMMKGIFSSMKREDFSYWRYLIKRCVRLWPLVLLMGIIALSLGYFLMLPDDYENVSESVIASNFFANNILASITTRNYWNVSNTYRPLMHTWYLGILMQAYIIFPIFIICCNKVSHNNKNVLKWFLALLTMASLIAYLLPFSSASSKFYYLPYRTFELTLGALIAFVPFKKIKLSLLFEIICTAILIGLLCINSDVISSPIKLIITCFSTAYLLFIFQNTQDNVPSIGNILAFLGKCSLSIYLCHQVIVAFMFYSITDKINMKTFALFILVVLVLSVFLYNFVEKPISRFAKNQKRENVIVILCAIVALFVSCVAGLIYMNAGVVRDIPEQGITRTNVHRGMHAEYCDKPYAWDVDFRDSGKTKIIVFGNSFGRDWANVLAESKIADKIEISYIYPHSKDDLIEREKRLQDADFMFWAIGPGYGDIPEYVKEIIPLEKLYIVGNKSFGKSNGLIYAHRNSANYLNQTYKLPIELLNHDEQMKAKYADRYIDLIDVVEKQPGEVIVFTPEGKFISHDCIHFTQFGAQYYAQSIDLSWLIKERSVKQASSKLPS